MSRDGSITLFYGDGEHRFRLPIGQLKELEENCKAGMPVIHARLLVGQWHVSDAREVLRLGLIGGGMSPSEANMLLLRYFDPPERPKAESIPLAQIVLGAALYGVPEEPLGKAEAAAENATTTKTTTEPDAPSGPPSTAPEPQWDSTRDRSINGASGSSLQ